MSELIPECASVDKSKHLPESEGCFLFFMYIQLMKNLKSYRPVYKIQRPHIKSPDSLASGDFPPSKKVNSEKYSKLKSCGV